MSIAWISHRGESIDAPENTLSAFKLSSARDVDGMECDIYFTSDKVVVCAHDSHTERTSQGVVKAEIPGTPFAELEKINVWNGKKDYPVERIPKFAGALKTLGADRTFYVEVKQDDPALLEALAREIDEAGIPHEQIVMISFFRNMVKLSKKYMPDIRTLWLTAFEEKPDGFHPDADEMIAALRELNADGVDAHCNDSVLNPEYIQKVKEAVFYFAVWTIDTPELAEKFAKMGVDSITSNCAGALCKKLGRFESAR